MTLAIEVVRILNIDENIIKKAVERFDGVTVRLQFVKEVKGVKIYNDNSATTPDATIAALAALGSDIVLIMGGFDKGLDMKSLISEIPKHCKAVVLFKENGTDRILGDVKKLNGVDVYEEESLVDCVNKAISITQLGDTLLYSPAFASFGKHFRNEYDRSDQFMKIVENL